MSDPSCQTYRELLGVYVVGAIEPAERAAVDAHLAQCYECREELAGLAVLPALLHRVSREEAERIAASEPAPDGEPVGVLDSLLRQVGTRRRTRRLKSAFATAAAIVVVAGGAVAASQALTQGSAPPTAKSVELVSARKDGIDVKVRYGKAIWGTPMQVKATGLPQWTQCKFWVVTKTGQRIAVGGWTVGTYGGDMWYPVRAAVAKSDVGGFILTAKSHRWSRTVRIPAA